MASTYGSIQEATVSVNGNGETEFTPLVKEPAKPVENVIEPPLWEKLVFGWFTPLLHRGNEQKKLEQEDLDLIPLPEDCQTSYVSSAFDKYWNEERNKSSPSLFRALVYAYSRDFMRAGALKLIHDLCVFVGPQVLHAMIVFLRDPDALLWRGLGLTLAVTLSQLSMSLCLRHYFFKCYTTGLRVRTAVVVSVYRKALVLSAAERQVRTLGEITNLTSIDAQRLQELTSYLHALWYSPLQIGLALFFLWQQLGASSLGGVCIIIIMIPVTKFVAQWMGRMQKTLMKAKDQRVELNSEVLSGMKVIKFQAWEESFQQRILGLREIELKQLLHYFIGLSCSRMLWTFTPLLVALATFAAYVWSGHRLDVASALTSLALFDILRFPLFMLPQIINNVVEAMVALNRIQSFLLCDEHKPVGPGDLKDTGVKMKSLSAAYDSKRPKLDGVENDPKLKELADKQWEVQLLKLQLEDAERHIRDLSDTKTGLSEDDVADEMSTSHNLLCLRRIDFECKPGELIAVVGGVGCGKSSFLNAILGEVRQLSGTASVRGSLAYFSQTPFILNASIRDNILFGHVEEEVDEELYQRALDCCALRHDLELLSDGDETEIGEKGITLSGGQKARVALARAVYHRADVSLIDDALSAVDAHVAKQLFDTAIVDELLRSQGNEARRSVVLVTNALQHLSHPRVDRIVVLREGRVVESGRYEELANISGSVFARFLAVLNETGVSQGLTEGYVPSESLRDSVVSEKAGFSATKGAEKDEVMKKKQPLKLMSAEARATGHVGFHVYLSWFRAAGGLVAPITILLAFACTEGISVLSNWWLTYWSEHGSSATQTWFLTIYAVINLSAAVTGLGRALLVVYFGLRASRKLFADLLAVVLYAPMSFFDTTPVGRILNRFSKDIYTIDEQLNGTLRTYLQTLFSVFSTVAVISGVTPVFTLCLIPMIIFYLLEQSFFTITYRELKRLDSVNRSPIYALLGESVDGVAVIRAFSAQESLFRRLFSMLDVQQHAYFLTCAAQSWLAVRLELVGTFIITFASLSAVLEHAAAGANETFAGLAGLAISYALSVTQSLNWSVRMASDMEANMVAVERVEEYTKLDSEGSRHAPADKGMPDWPASGDIVFKGAKLRYRPGLPLVLKGLDIHIPAGCKVGVVGRTGAGKSTLMVALMRIVELSEGKIFIDGKDTRTVGLSKLRSNIAVIPQDPVLFSGSLRTNLDPFGHYDDVTLLEALERVGLYSSKPISSSSHSLSSMSQRCIESLSDEVSEGGSNFSVGQRQLIVISRALLQGARIVVMDEATASVDAETDADIQKVMRNEFASATCITVAHRINTILDCDRILVMSDGKAAEFDTPRALLDKGGMFRELVKAASRDSYI